MYDAVVFLIYIAPIILAFGMANTVVNAISKHYEKKLRSIRREKKLEIATKDMQEMKNTYQNLILKQIMEGCSNE